MPAEVWGFIGVVVGALLAGGSEWLREARSRRERTDGRDRNEQASAFAQLLVASRALRYAARPHSGYEQEQVDEHRTDLSTAQYLIEMRSNRSVVDAGEAVRRTALDYVNARESKGPQGDCQAEREAARNAVEHFTTVARTVLSRPV